MRYFDHDTTASTDPGIMSLRLLAGGAAVDAYWYMVELMYREETNCFAFANQVGLQMVSHMLNTDEKTLESYVSAMCEVGLFERVESDVLTVRSERVGENVAAYSEKRETLRQNAKKGGRKPTRKPDANQKKTKDETKSEPEAKLRKEKKGFGLDKTKPNQALGGPPAAAAAGAAPDGPQEQWSSGLRCECGGLYEIGGDGSFALVCRECGRPYVPQAEPDNEPLPPEPAYLPVVPPPEVYPWEAPDEA